MPHDTLLELPDEVEEIYLHLKNRMRAGHLNPHHRLPSTRGGNNGPRNIAWINEIMHRHWHTLTVNKIGREASAQFSVWWQNDYIFKTHRKGKFQCDGLADGTKSGRRKYKPWWRIRDIEFTMSGKQITAWNELFGHATPPEVVVRLINEFLVHPDTPLTLIPSSRS